MSPVIESTYEVIKEIGAGGGGVVYLARHKRLGKWVVLKADRRPLSANPDKLRREADMLKNLSQNYIPQVYDFIVDEEADTAYTVIDYIEGKSLKDLQEDGYRFPQPLVIQWACQLLEALVYLHNHTENGEPHCILHGDIKPANVMLTPEGDIRLIDFNIALDLGDESAVWVRGSSYGYASPEQYGTEYPGFLGGGADTGAGLPKSETYISEREWNNGNTVRGSGRMVDRRSDIYSLGATLYRLLSGRLPGKFPENVVPLSRSEASPAVAAIIRKAMSKKREDRYQTAEEMLRAFQDLYPNDPRMKRHRRRRIACTVLSLLLLLAGGILTFAGHERIRWTESAYVLAEYSSSALREGDVEGAVRYALDALPEQRGFLDPPCTAQAERALSNALGVYHLADGYKAHNTISLPSEPIKAVFSPDGSRIGVLVEKRVLVFEAETGTRIAELNAEYSAMSDLVFRDNDVLIYAGEGTLTAYHLQEKKVLWESGKAATGVSLSADGGVVAAVYKDENVAGVYDALTGAPLRTVSFQDRKQRVAANDVFADPGDNLFVLDETGRWLAVSFDDGSLRLFNLYDSEQDIEVYGGTDFTHFEGGFYGSRFAFVSTKPDQSDYAAIDLNTGEWTDALTSESPFHLQADAGGVYLSSGNVLLKIDPYTGERSEAGYAGSDIVGFVHGAERTLVLTKDQRCLIFDGSAAQAGEITREARIDFAALSGSLMLLANRDAPVVQILKWQHDSQAVLMTYEPAYRHDEARVSEDLGRAVLFRFDRFRVIGADGQVIADRSIPDAPEVYDQQYRRAEPEDYLEVIYNDGTVRSYSARTGDLMSEEEGQEPDGTLYEEFETEDYLIRSPLHGTPEAYGKADGKPVRPLEQDAYLTYVTQVGEHIITEYVTADGLRYGLLLDRNLEVLADLPDLCDILPNGTLVFDDGRGTLLQSRIFSLQELRNLAAR